MNSYEKNSKDFNKAINRNTDRQIRESYEQKYSHQERKNFPDPDKESKFDMTDKYFDTHMKPNSKYN
jgi:hypothetical protein